MAARSFRVEIFQISIAAVLLEISYTRIFSYKLYHYFVFLTIGIALLGLGSGGVFVAVSSRLRAVAPERLIPLCCLGASLAVPLGYLIIAPTQLNVVDLTPEAIDDSLGALLKYQDDIGRIRGSEAGKLLDQVRTELGLASPT